MFILSQVVSGIGGAGITSLGAVYIDENLSEKGAPIAMTPFFI